MEEELSGDQGTWWADGERVRARFGSGRRVPHLCRVLGGFSLPLEAVREVEFDRGDRKRGWRLRLRLVEGTDPYAEAAAGASDTTPLVLTGPGNGELLAEYFSDRLRSWAELARGGGREPDPRTVRLGLVGRTPLKARTAEGTAEFDGTRVRIRWDGLLAGGAKQREKSREYPLSEIGRLTWTPPVDVTEGHLRVLLRGVTIPDAAALDHDLFTLASHGAKGAEETLLMAATVNAHTTDGPPAPPSAGDGGETVFATIRELGRLHEEGLLTDEEFAAKKAELLRRL
ncbi:DUF4429 domain-containing protein [Nocardiopsis sp. LOL_012]|uniref:DUF4429 domain-containing protein n=1 Tax=Nocardiopsis sp. LOL_012 TaxID=3345409 RepID=UPI003A8A3232